MSRVRVAGRHRPAWPQPPADRCRQRLHHKGRHRYMWNIATISVATLLYLICSLGQLASSELIRPISTHGSQYHMHQPTPVSGIYNMMEICNGRSRLPSPHRIEGAVVQSSQDTYTNCTTTFRTKTSYQHLVVRFEELKLGCDDHLILFDGDVDYGQPSIKDFSCRDSLASAPVIKTTGTYLTLRYISDGRANHGDGFKFVITSALYPNGECPIESTLCRGGLCVSKLLFCDGINHCVDNSDEINCSSSSSSSFVGWPFDDVSLSNALGLLVVLMLILFACVIIIILTFYCRRDNYYAQYQNQLQRAIGLQLHPSSSVMFANAQPQYHYFQPANFSPYVTPQHHATLANTTIPRGYSTLPMNITRQQQPNSQAQASPILAKPPNLVNNDYIMMTSLAGPPTAAMQAAPALQTSLYLPNSQSILTTNGLRNMQAQKRE